MKHLCTVQFGIQCFPLPFHWDFSYFSIGNDVGCILGGGKLGHLSLPRRKTSSQEAQRYIK